MILIPSNIAILFVNFNRIRFPVKGVLLPVIFAAFIRKRFHVIVDYNVLEIGADRGRRGPSEAIGTPVLIIRKVQGHIVLIVKDYNLSIVAEHSSHVFGFFPLVTVSVIIVWVLRENVIIHVLTTHNS